MRTRGFTLIELMIVVMLIAVATAVAAPRLADQIAGARVRKAARDFCSLCRLARSRAASEVTEYVLVMDKERHVMFVRAKAEKQRHGASLMWRELPFGVRVYDASGGGGENSEFRFRPDGTVKDDAEVGFRDQTGRTIKVKLDAITGKAKVVS